MNIIEEEKTEISLRNNKKKYNQKKLALERYIHDFSQIANNIYFTKKKRERQKIYNKFEEEKESYSNITNKESKIILKIKELRDKLAPKYIIQKEFNNEFDLIEENRRKNLVNELIKDKYFIDFQKDIFLATLNVDIFCIICENYWTICLYNNNFLIDTLKILDRIILKSFEFKKFEKSVSSVMNLCYLIFEYKLFDDKTKEKYLNFFIAILIDNNYNTKLNLLQIEKNYIFYIIYTLFNSSPSNSNNIQIKEDKIILFIQYIFNEINTILNNINQCYEKLELILKVMDELCNNENFKNIFKNNKNNLYIIKEINKIMNNILNRIINGLDLDEKQEIINDGDINFIVRFSMNIIIKNIIEINDIYNNDIYINRFIINEDIYNFIKGFIIGISYLNLDEKNYCYLIGLMEILIDIPCYQNLFIENEIQIIIINRLRFAFPNKISTYFKFLQKILNKNEILKNYLENNDFKKIFEDDNILKYNIIGCIEYLNVVLILIENVLNNKNLNIREKNMFSDCNIKEKIELIFNSTKNNNVINKCISILNILDKIIK